MAVMVSCKVLLVLASQVHVPTRYTCLLRGCLKVAKTRKLYHYQPCSFARTASAVYYSLFSKLSHHEIMLHVDLQFCENVHTIATAYV